VLKISSYFCRLKLEDERYFCPKIRDVEAKKSGNISVSALACTTNFK